MAVHHAVVVGGAMRIVCGSGVRGGGSGVRVGLLGGVAVVAVARVIQDDHRPQRNA